VPNIDFRTAISAIEDHIKKIFPISAHVKNVYSSYKQTNPKNFLYTNTTHVFTFNPITLKLLSKIQFDALNISAYYSTPILTRDDRFFVTGSSKNPGNFTFEYNHQEKNMTSKSPMISGRRFHALDEIRENYLLAVGGQAPIIGHTKHCEVYDVINNK